MMNATKPRRTKRLFALAACLLPALPAQAQVQQIGRIDLDITSAGSNAPVIVDLTGINAVTTIPVEVSFSATASGSQGVNRGVSGLVFKLSTGLPLIDQVPMTLPKTFTNTHKQGLFGASSTIGAGFDLFNDSGSPADADNDGTSETIDSVAAYQGLTAQFHQGQIELRHLPGPDQENAGHDAPVLMATGEIQIHPNTPAGTYALQVDVLSALGVNATLVWDTTSAGAIPVSVPATGDSLSLVIVPEPATIALLPLAATVLLRRRKK